MSRKNKRNKDDGKERIKFPFASKEIAAEVWAEAHKWRDDHEAARVMWDRSGSSYISMVAEYIANQKGYTLYRACSTKPDTTIEEVLHALGFDDDDVERWMSTPLPILDNMTPTELMESDKVKELKAKFIAFAQGNLGL